MPGSRQPRDAWAGWRLVAVAVVMANVNPVRAQDVTPVALELVLAVDSSSSVSDEEYDLQMRGIAEAFRDPDVVEAIADLGDRGMAVTVVQWSGGRMQRVTVEWMHLGDSSSVDRFASLVTQSQRQLTGGTNLGGAIRYSLAQLETNRFEGQRRVVDVSGDGFAGLSPRRERDRALSRGVTINGLAILNEEPALGDYFAAHPVGGAGAFVLTADSYEDFVDAMRDKLIQEISSFTIAAAGTTPAAIAETARDRAEPFERDRIPRPDSKTAAR
ncbi:MAG: DUF1194 domain-containing protein [Alphaproteobacteria bacterium]|nr:DUF1194 domain-containing protein [Alphaproteobacteria bacterium]